MALVIAVLGSDGGAGATTVAVNLACSLAAEPDNRVVLVDLDFFFGDADVALDLLPERTLYDVAVQGRGLSPASLHGSLARHEATGLLYLASPHPARFDEASQLPVDDVQWVIEMLRWNHTHLVLDLSRGMLATDPAIVYSADILLLVARPALASLRNVVRMLLCLQSEAGFPDRAGVILNRVGDDPLGERMEIAKVEEAIGRPLLWQVPYDPTAVAEASAAGEPLIRHAPQSKVHQAIAALASAFCPRRPAEPAKLKLASMLGGKGCPSRPASPPTAPDTLVREINKLLAASPSEPASPPPASSPAAPSASGEGTDPSGASPAPPAVEPEASPTEAPLASASAEPASACPAPASAAPSSRRRPSAPRRPAKERPVPPATAPALGAEELVHEWQHLGEARRQFEQERRQLQEDEAVLIEQMRQMDAEMARQRAELARQRTEFQRLQDEARQELRSAPRDSGIQPRLSNRAAPRPSRPSPRPSAGAAAPRGDAVDCSVFAPPSVAAGDALMVQVFAHTPEQTDTAQQMAREFDEQAERRGKRSLEMAVARGSRLTFHLEMPGLLIERPIESLIWKGQPESVQFEVTVPEDRKPGTVVGTVTVSQDNIPIGHVKFKLSVTAAQEARSPRPAENVTVDARRYRRAFISYASADRPEVLKRVQMLRQLGIEFFQDLLDLEPGSRWEQELYRHIDESDLFLLFWSTAARESRWVREEVRYALKRKQEDDLKPPEIKPVIIEGPPPPPPPEELAHLHFNDYLVYFLAPKGGESA